MNNLFTFKKLDSALKKAGSYIGAAELHGLQTGIICASPMANSLYWENILMQELDCIEISAELMGQLNGLYARTAYQLQGIDFRFELLLPNDSTSINSRAHALANWCRGFICGLGLAGVQDDTIHSTIAEEAIRDLSEIANVCLVEEELLEVQEKALFELVEYVRIAMQTIQMHLRAGKALTANECFMH